MIAVVSPRFPFSELIFPLDCCARRTVSDGDVRFTSVSCVYVRIEQSISRAERAIGILENHLFVQKMAHQSQFESTSLRFF